MRRSSVRELIVCVTAASSLFGAIVQAQSSAGSAFTYQGRLNDAGSSASGLYDLEFTLHDAAQQGRRVGNSVSLEDVEVKNGLFTVELDFGHGVFDGKARFLEVAVRPGDGEGEYTTLEPRQPLTPAPYALFALSTPADVDSGSSGPRGAGNHWGETWTGTDTGLTLSSSDGIGLQGESADAFGTGVYGLATSSTAIAGTAPGVLGVTQSDGPDPNTFQPYYPAGVRGEATSGVGLTIGVLGTSFSSQGRGVAGFATNTTTTEATYGVWGSSHSTSGTGVHGLASQSFGNSLGVAGESKSFSGIGVKGTALTTTGATTGVLGEVASSTGTGVRGLATAALGTTYGVFGVSGSNAGQGVYGYASSSSGITTGVSGQSDSPSGAGLRATARLYGVYAQSTATSGAGYGVYAIANSDAGRAIFAHAGAPIGATYGVQAQNNSNSGTGVYGIASAATGTTYGVQGHSASPTGRGVYAYNSSSGVGLYARSASGNPIEAYGSNSADREFRVENAGHVYADGIYNANGADFAELLPGGGNLEPGDVLAVSRDGKLRRSVTAFQQSVLGVYSTDPGFLGGSSGEAAEANGKVPLAVVGVVPVKVTAENGPIRPGDLLVASSDPGRAMNGGLKPPQGTVLGKALQKLESGIGTISVLVTLQ